jgi:anaerobic ribonucleoside-triphosphate reductase activating protein
VVIWFQGCTIGCDGCISKHTWKFSNKYKKDLNEVMKTLINFENPNITISGGEPFDQADSLYILLKGIREHFSDILVYSGYSYEYLEANYKHILNLIDVLIDSPFIDSMPSLKAYKGSKNQNMIIFNKKLVPKYREFFISEKSHLQIYQNVEQIYFIGVPNINIERIINGT